MSNVNIKRLVENIRSNTTVYTPVVEMIVNAIQAIDESERSDGHVSVRVQRDAQPDLDGGLGDVRGIEVEDNGVGFTDSQRDSFDTLYTDTKIEEGGKGFGRFTCLKYFEDLKIDSVYEGSEGFRRRTFSMGKQNDIIVGEDDVSCEASECKTIVQLDSLKEGRPNLDRKLSTIARNLVERLLPYFITRDYACPDITIAEHDGSSRIRLNDFVRNELSAQIKEITFDRSQFSLKSIVGDEDFLVRVFRFYAPKNQKSRISLVAHKREVSGSALHKYIPEFEEEFFDQDAESDSGRKRNFIIKAYVFGSYLDRNVSLERGGFEFQMDSDLLHGIPQSQIEHEAAEIAKEALGSGITQRQEKKRERVQKYVDEEAPWHKSILAEIDLSDMPYRPSDEEIETRLQKEKFTRELAIKREVAQLLADSDSGNLHESVLEVVSRISGSSKNDLVHYIALRRKILDIFGKSLESDASGSYSSEGVVHDVIFPRKGDTEVTTFEDHNLWMIDERLNFTEYVSSDLPLEGGVDGRPDLLVYNNRILFRGDNEPSNPITIFEFKKPQRDDFVNPSSTEDPVQQIVRYVNKIRDGKYKTPGGRNIRIAENTPFYGYVICDLSPKVEAWLEREKNFKPMPDRLGWFQWMENINLYVEVISWDKVLNDAKLRNAIFFRKLGI